MTVQTAGSLTLEIGPKGDRQKIVLSGQVGDQIQVGFRAKDGAPEIKIGTFTTIVGSVAEAFGAGPTFQSEFEAKLTALAGANNTGPLAAAVNQLRIAQLFITDMYLQANYLDKKDSEDGEGEYKLQNCAFGFRVEFSDLTIGGLLTIVGFGILFEYTPPPTKGKPPVSRLTARAQ